METANETDAENRNWFLFLEIANVMEFQPDLYDQQTWGKYTPDNGQMEEFQALFGYVPYDEQDYNWTKVEDCGTALCLAGHAAMLTGWFPTRGATYNERPTVSWASVCRQPGQDYVHGENVAEVAEEALGISPEEASHLFSGGANWKPDEIRAFGRGEQILPEHDAAGYEV